MPTFIFHSRFRSANFEDIPEVSVRDYQVRTDDEAVAQKLRMKKGLWEVPQIEPPKPVVKAPDEPPKPVEAMTDEERFELKRPKIVRGMKKTSDTEGKK